MKVENVTGYFDCRQYKANTPRSSRVMIENGGRINFSVGFTDEELENHPQLKDFANKSEKSGINYVTFKVFPKTCKLYLASAKRVDFPDNALLDGGKFVVNMDVNIKHGTGTELNGCYVNAMQIIKRADNPFDVVEDGDDSWIDKPADDPFDAKKEDAKPASKKKAEKVEEVDDLPF